MLTICDYSPYLFEPALSDQFLEDYLEKVKQAEFKPTKLFSIDRVFRNETLDQTHLADIHQVGAAVVNKNLSFAHIIGLFTEFFQKCELIAESLDLAGDRVCAIWTANDPGSATFTVRVDALAARFPSLH